MHVYPDHLFLVIHAPEIGSGGHVHYLELDQFIGEHYLVTVHGPLNPKVPLEAALRETPAVARADGAGPVAADLAVRADLRHRVLDRPA